MKFRFKKSSRTTAGLLAGASFIAMAIYSWGLPLSTALLFLAICATFLLAIVALAALTGFLLGLVRKSFGDDK